nr:PREDICTED: oncostatin-M-specific receptor subunit beta isoform X1 [Latimeria chalumnae]|eukprot:XP_006000409.1 PREDICTED: oncostatin-M-specific receptor subunit beta isoform X1 [Latimeria chalumnae]
MSSGGKIMDSVVTFKTLLTGLLILRTCQTTELITYPPKGLRLDPDFSSQQLSVKWNVNESAYESELNMTFQIQVSRTEYKNINYTGNFSTSLRKANPILQWEWDSELPLECTSHSVRIRSIVNDEKFSGAQVWSNWSAWQTVWGKDVSDNNENVVFPNEKVVKQGSSMIFCCIAGVGKSIDFMKFGDEEYLRLPVSDRSQAIRVNNISLSPVSGRTIHCNEKGATVFVGYPPDVPKNLICETRDLQTITCKWDRGNPTNLYGVARSTKYSLFEWFSGQVSECSGAKHDECRWGIVKDQQDYNFTLIAENGLGKTESSVFVTITDKVHPLQPSDLAVYDVEAERVLVLWSLKADYSILSLLCQIEINKSIDNVEQGASYKEPLLEQRNYTVEGRPSTKKYDQIVDQLHPNTNYTFRVRCAADSVHLWKWSEWSKKVTCTTREAAPSVVPDVWRQIYETSTGRNVTLHWKPPSLMNANGHVLSYYITWKALLNNSDLEFISVSASLNRTEINITKERYLIEICAVNAVGLSPPSKIWIPKFIRNGTFTWEKANGTGDGISLSWHHYPSVTKEYTVEWCNFPRGIHCDLQWKKFPANITNAIIASPAFEAGVRYNFMIYGYEGDGDHLLEKKVGYIKETDPNCPKVDIKELKEDSVLVTWNYNDTDETKGGFIRYYSILVSEMKETCNTTSRENSLSGTVETSKILTNYKTEAPLKIVQTVACTAFI